MRVKRSEKKTTWREEHFYPLYIYSYSEQESTEMMCGFHSAQKINTGHGLPLYYTVK